MSKRHSHGSVAALVAAEYEPQALVNFVALMGCSFSSDTLPLPDLAAEFDLSRGQYPSIEKGLSVMVEQVDAFFCKLGSKGIDP